MRFWMLLGIACASLLGAVPRAGAYEMPLAELYQRILARAPAVSRAIIDTSTTVFAAYPQAPTGILDLPADAVPVERPERAYRQRIYWIRDRFLGVETFSATGARLNLFIDEGFQPVMFNTEPQRLFAARDVRPPFLPFLGETLAGWRAGLNDWGVLPSRYDLVQNPKGTFFYRLLDGPGRTAWVEREPLRLTRIETEVPGEERPIALTIHFVDFVFSGELDPPERNLRYPRTVDFLVDGRLFKQVNLVDVQSDPPLASFPVTRLRREAQALAAERAATEAAERAATEAAERAATERAATPTAAEAP